MISFDLRLALRIAILSCSYCLMKTKVVRNWYQSIHFDELYCRQASFSGPQWIPGYHHERSIKVFSVLSIF
jgi:hypothetical protein